jgi:hypothetical protein
MDLFPIIGQIASYYMDHNDEPDACDFLRAASCLRKVIALVKEETYSRVCTYLMQCYDFLPHPENNEVLTVVYDICVKMGQDAQALVITLKLNDRGKITVFSSNARFNRYHNKCVAEPPVLGDRRAFAIRESTDARRCFAAAVRAWNSAGAHPAE